MAPLPDYVAGTITLTNGDTAFTGTGTGWLAAGFREGDTILGIEDNEGVVYVVETIDDNDAGTLTQPWQGATGTYTYRMRYLSDGQRVTAQARQLIELLGNGNLQALAGLSGTPNTLAMFTGAGAMVEVPRTDLVSGANYDVQVDTLPDRDAYDGQDAGFAVLVSDVGDGRAAIYSKLSNASGDWSAPAYVTGPSTDVTVGTVTELDYGDTPTITGTSGPGTLELDFGLPGGPALSVGSVTRGDADVTSTPVTGGYELDFTIPSQVAQGDYSGATAYVTGDIVQDQGSSWVALQATTGNAPPTLPTTSNAYWQLLARAGNDGAGTVTTLVAGDGVGIDNTDPTMPVVSVAATPFVLSLFDDLDDAEARGTLGATVLGSALFTAADATAARTALDAEAATPTSLTNDDDINSVADGWYRWTSGANKPANAPTDFAVMFQKSDGNQPVQVVYGRPSSNFSLTATRRFSAGAPDSWSYSGAQYGSNANGEYVRFADGTQICWIQSATSNSSDVTLTWPSAFSAVPRAVVGANTGLTQLASAFLRNSVTATGASLAGYVSAGRSAITASIIVVGRWF